MTVSIELNLPTPDVHPDDVTTFLQGVANYFRLSFKKEDGVYAVGDFEIHPPHSPDNTSDNWILYGCSYRGAQYHRDGSADPPDVDVSELETCESAVEAAACLITLTVEDLLQHRVNDLGQARAFQEEQQRLREAGRA